MSIRRRAKAFLTTRGRSREPAPCVHGAAWARARQTGKAESPAAVRASRQTGRPAPSLAPPAGLGFATRTRPSRGNHEMAAMLACAAREGRPLTPGSPRAGQSLPIERRVQLEPRFDGREQSIFRRKHRATRPFPGPGPFTRAFSVATSNSSVAKTGTHLLLSPGISNGRSSHRQN